MLSVLVWEFVIPLICESNVLLLQGPYSREDGFLGYNEVCEELLDKRDPWTVEWEDSYHAPYMYRYHLG